MISTILLVSCSLLLGYDNLLYKSCTRAGALPEPLASVIARQPIALQVYLHIPVDFQSTSPNEGSRCSAGVSLIFRTQRVYSFILAVCLLLVNISTLLSRSCLQVLRHFVTHLIDRARNGIDQDYASIPGRTEQANAFFLNLTFAISVLSYLYTSCIVIL